MGDRHADRPEDEQLHGMIASARACLDDLELGIMIDRKRKKRSDLNVIELMRRSRHGTRDGFPTSSGLRQAGGPATVLDDEGKPMPPRSDPVGELVITEPWTDPVRRSAGVVVRNLKVAVGQLNGAVSALAQAIPPREIDFDPGCVVHARVSDTDPVTGKVRHRWMPVEEGRTRCSWCHDFRLAHGEDPPPSLVRAHDDGQRMNTKLIAEHMAYAKAAKRSKKKRAS